MTDGTFNPDRFSLARDLRGMTQTALAQATGIDQATLSKFEHGIMVPNAGHVDAIGEALGFPVAWFYLDGKRYGIEPSTINCKW